MTSPPPILDSFVERLAVRDFEGLAACLDPDVRLRAIIPPGSEEHHGRAAAAGRFNDWFGDAVSFEPVEHRIEPFVDRWLVTYRIALDEGDGLHQVEQHLFCDLGAELIERIDLLCSGFRPVVLPAPSSVHRFDAETLACQDEIRWPLGGRVRRMPTASDPQARSST